MAILDDILLRGFITPSVGIQPGGVLNQVDANAPAPGMGLNFGASPTPQRAALEQANPQTRGILDQISAVPGLADGLLGAGAGLLSSNRLREGLAAGFQGFNTAMTNSRKLSLEEMRAKKPNLTPTGQPGIFLAVYPDGRQETVVVDAAVQAAAANEARTDQRQQNLFDQQKTLADKRFTQDLAIEKMRNDKPKPLPAGLQKVENEYEAAISAYVNNVNTISPVIDNLTRNKQTGVAPLELGPLKNAYNSSRNLFGKSTDESLKYQELNESKTRFVNESLRLNKGVQTEGDAQRAAKELNAAWAQNDTEASRKAFERLEEVNIRAANDKANLINKQRAAQGFAPIYSGPIISSRSKTTQNNVGGSAGQTSTGVTFTIETER